MNRGISFCDGCSRTVALSSHFSLLHRNQGTIAYAGVRAVYDPVVSDRYQYGQLNAGTCAMGQLRMAQGISSMVKEKYPRGSCAHFSVISNPLRPTSLNWGLCTIVPERQTILSDVYVVAIGRDEKSYWKLVSKPVAQIW